MDDNTSPALALTDLGLDKPLAVHVYTDSEAFGLLRMEWDALHDATRAELFFLSSRWQELCWKHLQRGTLQIIAVRTQAGALCGLAPFWLLDDEDGPTLRLGGAEDVSDYLDLMARRGQEEAVLEQILDFLLLDPAAPRWSRLMLEYVPEPSATLAALSRAAEARGLHATQELQEVCPVVPLPPTFTEYLARLTASRRASVLRKRRRTLVRGGHWYRVTHGSPDVENEIESFFALMSESDPCKQALLATRGMRPFLHDLLHDDSTRAELVFLVVDRAKVAAVLQFAVGDSVLFYNSARRSQAEGSPGFVLLSFCIEDAIRRGFRCYDLLRGEEGYKYRLGGCDRATYRFSIVQRELCRR